MKFSVKLQKNKFNSFDVFGGSDQLDAKNNQIICAELLTSVDDDGEDNEDDEVFDSGNDSSTLSAAAAAPIKTKRRSQSLNALNHDLPAELQTVDAEALVSHRSCHFSAIVLLCILRQWQCIILPVMILDFIALFQLSYFSEIMGSACDNVVLYVLMAQTEAKGESLRAYYLLKFCLAAGS
jgi:hypothetical protein